MNALLETILKDEHREKGLCLTMDEDFIYLRQHGHTVATFSAYGVTFEEIHKEADKFLVGDAVKELVSCGGIEVK